MNERAPGSEARQIEIDGVSFSWDGLRDLFLINGMPAVGMLIDSTLAHMMWGFERMAGLERFDLVLQAAGRQSIEGEWEGFISKMPSVEAGLRVMGQLTPLGGLGRWQVVRFSVEEREACFRVTSGFEPLYQQSLGVAWGSSFLAGKFAGYCARAFGVPCWADQTASAVRGDQYDEFVVRPSDLGVEQRLEALLKAGKATAADLAAALERVRVEVDERRATEARLLREAEARARVEAELRAKLRLIEEQAADIKAMSTPILRVRPGVLAVPVVGRLDGVRAAQMQEALLSAVTAHQARVAIVDLTGAEGVDAHAIAYVPRLARSVALLGARCLVSGISPGAAKVAADLGVDLHGMSSHATLEAALGEAGRLLTERVGGGPRGR